MNETFYSKLSAPFPPEDIEWRVARAGIAKKGVYCMVLAYITARAIQERLDEVVGPANWQNTPLQLHEVRAGLFAMQVGISIKIGEEWVTKYDVSEPTQVEPAKGGFSGATKRAGAQWGIGRYLYYIDETFAETSDQNGGKGWNYATLPKDQGKAPYYWKTPTLPSWAVPKEAEHAISAADLKSIKGEWKRRFAPEITSPAELLAGFTRFVAGVCGEFPSGDPACWTRDAWEKCRALIQKGPGTMGVSGDVPFEK